MSNVGIAIFLGIIIVGAGVLSYGGINNWLVGLKYQETIGVYFEYADRSSDAQTKADYFNKYVEALKAEGLDQGSTSIFFQEQPNASLEDNFKVAQSLQARLNSIATMNPLSPEYQFAMQQVTMQEFCWFPTSSFYQGYALEHGAWGMSITPAGVYNRCATHTSSSMSSSTVYDFLD